MLETLTNCGLQLVPCKNKVPLVKDWRNKKLTAEELKSYGVDSFGVVCGGTSLSDKLFYYCIDFDGAGVFETYVQFLPDELRNEIETAYIQDTPSGGTHVVFRISGEYGYETTKLAMTKDNKVLIESRGDGAYFCIGKNYIQKSTLALNELVVTENVVVNKFISFAKSFDQRPENIVSFKPNNKDESLPGNSFNREGDVVALLEKHGWKVVKESFDKYSLCRPNKSGGVSATFNMNGSRMFYVFSSNAHPFKNNTGYSPFSVYCMLETGGDAVLAASTLREQGFGWDKFIPLIPTDPPEFPLTNLFPSIIDQMVREVSHSTQTPIDMPCMSVFGVLATAISDKLTVLVKDDWEEPCNLYIGVFATPSTRKSAVHKSMTKPLFDWEIEKNEQTNTERSVAKVKRKAIQKKIDIATDELSIADDDESLSIAEEKLTKLYEDLAVLPTGNPLTLMVVDATPEKLIGIMAQNNGCVSHHSDEGGLFEMMLGKYSSNGIADVYLQGYSGGSLKSHRVGREDDAVKDACLTLSLIIQPTMLTTLAGGQSRDRGLVGRFLFSYPNSSVGNRDVRTKPISKQTIKLYNELIKGLLNLTLDDKLIISYNNDAQLLREEISEWIEKELGYGSLYDIPDWGGKLDGQLARICGLLQFTENYVTGKTLNSPITKETVEKVHTLIPYLIAHAKICYGEMGMDDVTKKAQHIIRWFTRHKIGEFFARDVLTYNNSVFRTMGELERPLERLVSYGYLKEYESDKTKGRKTSKYIVRPNIRGIV